jgi:uncharacterized membrane protein YgaE (UPF0421/DUF939 family)
VGLGVDYLGGPVIDPTVNVNALVETLEKHNREIRDLERNHSRDLRDADRRYNSLESNSEARRLNDLAALKSSYDKQISDMLSVQVKTTSDLISTQLDKVTTALSAQITTLTNATQAQFATLTTTLGDRIAQVERFRYEWGGRTAVSDPATSDALKNLADAVSRLRSGEASTSGRDTGRSEMIAWFAAAVMLMAAVAALFIKHG